MKKIVVLSKIGWGFFLALFLLEGFSFGALKRVNLIRNGGAEGNPDVWREEYHPIGLANTAKINRKDSIDAYTGKCCFSIDTREDSPLILLWGAEFGDIFQDLMIPKGISEIDTLSWFVKTEYFHNDSSKTSEFGMIILMNDSHIAEPPEVTDTLFYVIKGLRFPEIEDREHAKIIMEDMIPSDEWEGRTRNLYKDIVELKGWTSDMNIITIGFWNEGYRNYDSTWLAQLALFDDAKLYGYADKDIELVKILSGDEISGSYTPSVEVHNNGRENEQNIPIKAMITNPLEDTLYNEIKEVDKLMSDSSVGIEFPLWNPEEKGEYKLIFLTGNYMGIEDECDVNDYIEKELRVLAVIEKSQNSYSKRSKRSPTISKGKFNLHYINAVEIYNIDGRLVKRVVGKSSWNSTLPSGVYFLKLDDKNTFKKMILIR